MTRAILQPLTEEATTSGNQIFYQRGYHKPKGRERFQPYQKTSGHGAGKENFHPECPSEDVGGNQRAQVQYCKSCDYAPSLVHASIEEKWGGAYMQDRYISV